VHPRHQLKLSEIPVDMEKVDPQTGQSKVAPNYGDKTTPIAIVGMACRYPGEATDPERLWKTCAEQRDVWQTTPTERFNQGIFYHPDPGRNGTVSEILHSRLTLRVA